MTDWFMSTGSILIAFFLCGFSVGLCIMKIIFDIKQHMIERKQIKEKDYYDSKRND